MSQQIGFCLLLKQIVKDLDRIAADSAKHEDCKIVGLHVFNQMKPMKIQIQIKHQNGGDVSLEDCARFSQSIEDRIEAAQLLNNSYVLEISSPGLNDILETEKEFETFKGFPIEVSTTSNSTSPILKIGLLHKRSKDHLLINVKGKLSKIPLENVIQVRLTNPTG